MKNAPFEKSDRRPLKIKSNQILQFDLSGIDFEFSRLKKINLRRKLICLLDVFPLWLSESESNMHTLNCVVVVFVVAGGFGVVK